MAGDISKNKNNNVTKQNKHKPHPLDGCTAIPRKILPPVARLFLVKIITRTIIYYSPILSISLNNNLDVLCVCVRVHNKLYERTIQGRGGGRIRTTNGEGQMHYLVVLTLWICTWDIVRLRLKEELIIEPNESRLPLTILFYAPTTTTIFLTNALRQKWGKSIPGLSQGGGFIFKMSTVRTDLSIYLVRACCWFTHADFVRCAAFAICYLPFVLYLLITDEQLIIRYYSRIYLWAVY
jgi:hypothetical protein